MKKCLPGPNSHSLFIAVAIRGMNNWMLKNTSMYDREFKGAIFLKIYILLSKKALIS